MSENNKASNISKANEDMQRKIQRDLERKFDELFGNSDTSTNSEIEDDYFDNEDEFNKKSEDSLQGKQEEPEVSKFPQYVNEFMESYECRDDQKEWLSSMPWSIEKLPEIDMVEAEEILDKSHYGLEEVKQRIMEFISLQKHIGKSYGDILLLAGPPGVGKTSIAKSIAKAMKREFVKIPLEGISTAFEIKGTEKSWKSAQPGVIIRSLRRSGTLCPVLLLDEMDKMGSSSEWASPESALLEVLDGDREHFLDSFLEVPVDLSNVVFIATANDLSNVSPILLDRMDIIYLKGYSFDEKMYIAKKHIIPYEMNAHKLSEDMLKITDNALQAIIEFYANEPGVRRLQSIIKTICRKAVYYYITKKKENLIVDKNMLTAILGYAPETNSFVSSQPEIGVVNTLGVTVGGFGVALPIEASIIPGDGDVCYTGGIVDEVIESCEVAMSIICIRSGNWNLGSDVFDAKDVHIHALQQGIKKKGSSMGLALYTALVSALLNYPVKNEIAMTGEITLKGKVMPVGGIEEKITAAFRAGIKTVFIPEGNRYHLAEIDEEILNNIKIICVSDVDEVIDKVLVK